MKRFSARTRLRTVVALVTVVVMLVATCGAAFAITASGAESEDKGPALSNGFQSWSASEGKIFTLQVEPTGTFSSGYCLDAWFDWYTGGEDGSGHFDSRVVRTCNQAVSISQSSSDAGHGRGLLGMQKAATCYGPNNKTVDKSSYCANAPDAIDPISSVGSVEVLPNTCSKSWRVEPGTTTIVYDSGGTYDECSS